MNKKTNWKLFGAWGRKRLAYIAFIAFLMFDYIVIGALMHYDLSTLIYCTLVGIFMGGVLAFFDFLDFSRKHQDLLNTYHNKAYSIENMPEPRGLIEQSYTTIIQALDEDLSDLRRQMKLQEQEADDYYTLWTHQIKTPIAAMRLILQDSISGTCNSQEERLALEGELFKVEQYADMALQYLRLESMSEDMMLKEYKLYEIVANALKKYAVYFIRNNLELEIEDFDEIVVTDEKWLQFVIEQILSNSVKYTPEGKITIAVEKTNNIEREPVLVIRDTGIGIHSEDVPRICDRGFTGYNGRMDKKSTGIGLYLCKKVTRKLSHTLEIQSSIGEGTTVRIGFPIDTAARTLQE